MRSWRDGDRALAMDCDPMFYLSYLLRLWLENGGEHDRKWRASLEDPRTHETRVFDNLEAVFEFLLQETKQCAGPEMPTSRKIGAYECDF